jgi:hypothetical protein
MGRWKRKYEQKQENDFPNQGQLKLEEELNQLRHETPCLLNKEQTGAFHRQEEGGPEIAAIKREMDNKKIRYQHRLLQIGREKITFDSNRLSLYDF